MPTFRVYEVQNEIVTRKWMYEIEASDESAAMSLIRNGEVNPVDCGTIGEPFYADSGFAAQSVGADSTGWEKALADLESVKGEGNSTHSPQQRLHTD
jgi:hypothetical protein